MKLLWGIKFDNVLTDHAITKLNKEKWKKTPISKGFESTATVALKLNYLGLDFSTRNAE